MNKYSIYDNFSNIGFNITANTISATSISANTFYGDMNAIYIGSGNPANFVTNQELSYLSSSTSNLQTQINTKTNNLQNYLIYSGDNSVLINSYKVVPGYNLTSFTDSNFYYVDAKINALTWNSIYHETSGNTNGVLVDYNPSGWSESYPNLATEILINPTNLVNLRNLSGQTDGRICKLTNVGKYPIIITNEYSSLSNVTSKFVFSRTISDFILKPNCSVNFIHTGSYWLCTDKSKYHGWDFIDRFTNVWRDINPTILNSTTSNFRSPIPFPTPTNFFVISAHTTNLPNIRKSGSRDMIYAIQYGSGLSFFVNNFDLVPQNKFVSIGQYNRNTILTEPNKMVMFESVYSFGNTVATNPITFAGFQNSYNQFGYSAATNSFTSFPNFNGGVFFLNDSGFSNNMIYCVQTNNGINITGTTNLATNGSSFGVTASNPIGMCILTPSGSSSGETIFYSKNGGTNEYTIYPKILHVGNPINAYPSLYMYVNRNITSVGYNTIGPSSNMSLLNIKMIEYDYD